MAVEMAQEAFDNAEVPVGCVFVREGNVIAKGRNRTNELMNVRHPIILLTLGYTTC